MVLTPSTMLPLGTPLPAFRLPRVNGPARPTGQGPAAADPAFSAGAPLDSRDLAGRPLLVLFLCAHCPFVKHIEPEIGRLERDYADHLGFVAIASNSILTHPQDGPEGLRRQAERQGWRFPYLFDADQHTARAFRAACTPDPFLFDAAQRLVYRGQLDASRPGNGLACDGRDMRAALDALLAGEPVNPEQQPAIGCNLKWHPGQAPAWG